MSEDIPAPDEPIEDIPPRRHQRMRLVIEGLLFVAVLIGVSVGTAFATFRAGDALKDFLLSLDGPAIVAQQVPYAADQAFTKNDLEGKYHIFLLTQTQATGQGQSAALGVRKPLPCPRFLIS